MMKDQQGLELSGCNARGLDLLEQAYAEFRCLRGDPVASADAALAAAPELVMAKVLRAWLHLLASERSALAPAQQALAEARALPHNEREAMHLAAIEQLCNGRWHAAAQALEDISVAYPRDAVALQAGHQLDFFVGDARMLRDRVARALPAWDGGVPGYHAVLGMYAFGLEECGDYALAERHGRKAVELEPADAWAQHAVAHVCEMQGRRDDGIRWMRGNPAWQQGSFLGTHNWWHLALYHLGQGDHGSVLELYDGPIDGHKPALLIELVDASALLWRLRLLGVDVGARWQSLAERWEPAAGEGWYAFNDMHAAMAYACTGREAAVEQLREAQRQAMARDDDNAMFTRDVGAPATEAMLAHVQGDYARAVRLLRPIRNQAQRFGGSHAQRDLIDLTLIHAARAGGQAALAGALEAERAAVAQRRREAMAS